MILMTHDVMIKECDSLFDFASFVSIPLTGGQGVQEFVAGRNGSPFGELSRSAGLLLPRDHNTFNLPEAAQPDPEKGDLSRVIHSFSAQVIPLAYFI